MPTIDIQRNPSNVLIVFLIFLMFGSIMIVFYMPINWLYQCGLIVLIFFYAFDGIWADGLLKSKNSIVHLQLLTTGDWKLTTHRNGVLFAQLHPESTVSAFALVLLFQIEKKHLLITSLIPSYFISKDISKEMYRNLLVHLQMRT